MNRMSSLDMPHLVASLALLVVAAHAAGALAQHWSLPAVVGELVAGLAFGPTVLGAISPALSTWVTSPSGETGGALRAVGQLGVLLLMFAAGTELRTLVRRSDLRSVSWIGASGVVVPAALGVLAMLVIDPGGYVGTANHEGALRIVLVTALAVTSIPVISRIFADLGLLQTRLARLVLGIAVLEDLVLYVALSYAVSLVAAPGEGSWTLPSALHLDPATWHGAVWHALASIGLLSLGMGLGRAQRAASRARANVVSQRSPVAWLLAVLFGCTLLASVLGLMPMLGALVAGITVAEAAGREQRAAIEQVTAFGSALFVPLYFVLTGAALDLRNDVDLVSVAALLVFGCVAKGLGVAIGARIAREPRHMSRALVVSLNARGGPGIVLATTAFAAGIVDARMFTSLLLLAVLTSIGAGAWLARLVRRSTTAPSSTTTQTPHRTNSELRHA
ncbi:MAG: sodium:proton antiporter [Thermoleophilia bacterium]|nr:sodium:proton antiporter [Thermoleophilia bacterium]